MNKKTSGGLTTVGIIALIVLVIVLKRSDVSVGGLVGGAVKIVIIILLLIAALVALVIVLAFTTRKDKGASGTRTRSVAPASGAARPATPPPASAVKLSPEQEEILKKGRSNLSQLRIMAMRVRSTPIRTKATAICGSVEKILNVLREKPESIPAVRQFLNYYLPTLGEIITKYERVERSGVDMQDMTAKVSEYLDKIAAAMDKQYENLFQSDFLDMTVEMEAMTMACKRDGLLTEEELSSPDSEVNLTL